MGGDPFAALSFAEGRIAFLGMVRVDDYGVHAFRVEIQERPPLYGEWIPKYEKTGNGIGVDVVSFGYLTARNVGNPHPDARIKLRADEALAVQMLVRALFNQDDLRTQIFPFASHRVFFTSEINFSNRWIVLAHIDDRR